MNLHDNKNLINNSKYNNYLQNPENKIFYSINSES